MLKVALPAYGFLTARGSSRRVRTGAAVNRNPHRSRTGWAAARLLRSQKPATAARKLQATART